MQLNVYVPRDKEPLIKALDEAAKRLGRQKNELVLDALETYLTHTPARLGAFHLGKVTMPPRDELHLERWKTEAHTP